MKKLITIIGARPQFIKAAAVSREIRNSGTIKEIIIHTGQHFDENMSSVFFKEMDIPTPDYQLEINSLTHGAMTGRMMESIEKILVSEKPDIVLVYGDTNTTLAGALTARKLDIQVAHVEAGLRSFNMKMPEEVNRIVTDRISDILFCPTDTAIRNLKNEGFDHFSCKIEKSGDVMYDAALFYGAISHERSKIITTLDLKKDEFIVCTIHRQENTDSVQNLQNIITSLNKINKIKKVVLPLHPRTRKIMEAGGLNPDFNVIEPLGYFDIVELLKHCSLVITDSGGMQKEAFFFDKFCITVRNETEWTELVDNGYNYLAGPDESKILKAYSEIQNRTFVNHHHFYGQGNASRKIIEAIS
ncbi:MAG TPA: UDP-N-acetylglucosamine 2-epimerase (non-hydrolyzing) [Bacteroidales bacterium]|nr:UDP-N-acetylglucosamine 2-epimerase (non-hydrolyzing) [Bacteroidales bacterium]